MGSMQQAYQLESCNRPITFTKKAILSAFYSQYRNMHPIRINASIHPLNIVFFANGMRCSWYFEIIQSAAIRSYSRGKLNQGEAPIVEYTS